MTAAPAPHSQAAPAPHSQAAPAPHSQAAPGADTAVIWDMGGILYRYFTEVVADMAAQAGWALDGVALGPTGALADPDYEAMSRGELHEAAYLAIVERRLADAGHPLDVRASITWSRQTREVAWAAIDAFRAAGIPQALLTNDATAWLGARWWETWAGAEAFDAIVDVANIGVRKPAPEPYLACARALGRAPSACLFVDDMVVNCDGAESVGMRSRWFDIRDPSGSIAALAADLSVDLPGSMPVPAVDDGAVP